MTQRSMAELFYDVPFGDLTGDEVIVLDVPLDGNPDGPDDYQSQGGKTSSFRDWIIASIPYASGTNAGLLSASQFNTIASLKTVATTGAYGDLSGKPALKTVATTGAYGDLSGKPGVATTSTNGLMSSGDKTKLDAYPQPAPTSLPPNGSAGGDLKGSYPNPQLADTISHGFDVAGAVSIESLSTPANDLGALPSDAEADFSLATHNFGTLQTGVDTDISFTAPEHSGFCVLQLFAPATGSVPVVTLPDSVIGTANSPDALSESTTTVFFYDGSNYCVVSSTPSH